MDQTQAALALMERVDAAQDKVLTYTTRLARIYQRSTPMTATFGDAGQALAECDLAAIYRIEPKLMSRMGALVDQALRLLQLIEETGEAAVALSAANAEQCTAFLDALKLFATMEPKSQHDTQVSQ